MALATDVLELDAAALLAAYRDRRLSPVEVTEAALGRIERDDPVLGAFCLVDRARALADAHRSEERWRAGTPAGALDGVPVAVKDILLTRGWPTLRGSRMTDPAGPWEDDAPSVAALRRHGAVLPGKTTTPEFGWKGVTDSPLTGITRNPWDPSRTAGGSSGGSSAALAAGMVPLALGTDGGGSIRIPCGFCGLPGIKPTFGRVPAWPASPYGTVAHVGPMARTVTDLALLLDVMAEPDPRDWTALPPPERSFREGLDEGVRGLRVAFSPDLGYVGVDSEVAVLVARAVDALAALGARVERADPGFADPREVYEILWSAGAGRVVAGLGDVPSGVLDPGFAAVAEAGRARSLDDYLTATARRDELGILMSRFHADWDLLVTPTLPIPAFAAGRDVPEEWPDPGWPSWTPFSYPFNLTQQPAATVPCGFTTAGLPVGLQIVGPRHGDALVLRAARAYEAAHPQPTLAPSPPTVR
jgi:aspartyl-tRNA(Asn)/glutamyl-tRNA(Gln) amidotransferase subunit A